MSISGIIIEQQKSVYTVDTPQGRICAATRGTLKIGRIKPCVGDHVELSATDGETVQAIITDVKPRKNWLPRPIIANLDQVFFVVTLKEPSVGLDVIDRFLVGASYLDLPVVLVFNKSDLMEDPDSGQLLEQSLATYRGCGYLCLETSATRRAGIDELEAQCQDKVSAFAGLSGVGKSSLLKCIFPADVFEVGELSLRGTRGTHTTTVSRLIKLGASGYIADTPGFATLDLPYLPAEEVGHHFPEIKQHIGECRFNNCLHLNEPGCVVKELVDNGGIAGSRHAGYAKFMAEMRTHPDKYRKYPR